MRKKIASARDIAFRSPPITNKRRIGSASTLGGVERACPPAAGVLGFEAGGVRCGLG